MLGKIEQVRDSKSGKTLGVKIGDRWYQSKAWELRNEVGSLIDFEPSTTEWQGNTMYWINDYSKRESGTTDMSPPPTASEVVNQVATKSNGSAVASLDPQFLPMTSNVVAHAIAAGLVKTPQDISAWASAAYHAAKHCANPASTPVVTSQEDPDFDDAIPF